MHVRAPWWATWGQKGCRPRCLLQPPVGQMLRCRLRCRLQQQRCTMRISPDGSWNGKNKNEMFLCYQKMFLYNISENLLLFPVYLHYIFSPTTFLFFFMFFYSSSFRKSKLYKYFHLILCHASGWSNFMCAVDYSPGTNNVHSVVNFQPGYRSIDL